ncbi:prepilin-type N-terminal cleavage/methylation domain-containing protein [Elusimicrobium posterum]|uniref:type IV pilin protein n=1 Tax=Elusimicrobium posterum TaxID=3116653 RepID=UPI003C7315E3
MKKGFTLIELLVVVLIIGILAGIAVPQYNKSVLRSRYTEAVILATAISQAQERFFLATSQYPSSLEELDIDLPKGDYSTCNKGNKCGSFADSYNNQLENARFMIGIESNDVYVSLKNSSGGYIVGYQVRGSGNAGICKTANKAPCKVCTSAKGNAKMRELCEDFHAGTYTMSSSTLDFFRLP